MVSEQDELQHIQKFIKQTHKHTLLYSECLVGSGSKCCSQCSNDEDDCVNAIWAAKK